MSPEASLEVIVEFEVDKCLELSWWVADCCVGVLLSVLAAGDGEGSTATGANVLKMGRFQVGDLTSRGSWPAPWAVPAPLCLVQDFAVPAELVKTGLQVLFAFRAGIAVVGTRFHPDPGLLFHWQCWHVHCVVSCFWGCCFLELILQMTHKCCSVWHCSAWREAVACFVVYLGNELFSPLKCISPLREIKASC